METSAGGASPSSWISRIEGTYECSSRSSEIPSRSAGSPKKEKQSSELPTQKSRHLSRQHRRQLAKWIVGSKEPPSLRHHHRHQSEGKLLRDLGVPTDSFSRPLYRVKSGLVVSPSSRSRSPSLVCGGGPLPSRSSLVINQSLKQCLRLWSLVPQKKSRQHPWISWPSVLQL
uniref:Uncharacterized protein n=1 Tax=Ditylenchus dipsaci TaxID=166011 RepID=A0A915EMY1_9BILA